MRAPRELSGVAASHYDLLKDRAIEAQHPGVIEELAEIEQAITTDALFGVVDTLPWSERSKLIDRALATSALHSSTPAADAANRKDKT
jgi:hypothetical protein